MCEIKNRTENTALEQAEAAWITIRNELRQNELAAKLQSQAGNLHESLKELEEFKRFIGDPKHILGSVLTKHGEIAEHAQVNFSNARNAILGLEKEYSFLGVDRFAPEDYLKNDLPVQSKFNHSVKNTLNAIKGHLKTYSYFVEQGGHYDIPRDQYQQIIDLKERFAKHPSLLSKEEYSIVGAIQRFEEETGLSFETDIEPSVINYEQSLQNNAGETLKEEVKRTKETDRKIRENYESEFAPSFSEGATITMKSAAIEGGVTFCMAVFEKIHSGKKLAEFTIEDWAIIAKKTGYGTIKGGIRGASIYVLTNFTKTPANLAAAYTTAAFGVIAQAAALGRGKITEEEFVQNTIILSLDIAIGAIGATIGKRVIPIPVLGAVIGSVVGEAAYSLCVKYLGFNETALIRRMVEEHEKLVLTLDVEYNTVIEAINKQTRAFDDMMELAFDDDMNIAVSASIELARSIGVPEGKIIKSMDELDDYFLK